MVTPRRGRPVLEERTLRKARDLIYIWLNGDFLKVRFKDLCKICRENQIATHNTQVNRILKFLLAKGWVEKRYSNSRHEYIITSYLRTMKSELEKVKEIEVKISELVKVTENTLPEERMWVILSALYAISETLTLLLYRLNKMPKKWEEFAESIYATYLQQWKGLLNRFEETDKNSMLEARKIYHQIHLRFRDPALLKKSLEPIYLRARGASQDPYLGKTNNQ